MTAQQVDYVPAPVLGDMGYSTMPEDLTPAERHAYHKGFDRGDRAHMKANGGPGMVHDGDAPAPGTAAHKLLARTLAESHRAYRIARHDKAHKAGMAAVRAYLRKRGQLERVAEIVDPLAPVKVKPAARVKRKAAPVKPDILAAGIESGRVIIAAVGAPAAPAEIPAPMPNMTRAARKASNRELAAAMRAAGVKITAESWEAAKAGTLAGVSA